MEKSTATSKSIQAKRMLNLSLGKLKTGNEKFTTKNKELSFSLLDFWQWSASDILSNSLRGKLAEFIVATATDIDVNAPREEWAAYDLITLGGIKIEVKSASYIQSWNQRKPSSIQFSIKPSKHWDSLTNIYSQETKRQADLYIFCLLDHKERATVNPLNMDQWSFYVVNTAVLDDKYPVRKTLSLKGLENLTNRVVYEDLNREIERKSNLHI